MPEGRSLFSQIRDFTEAGGNITRIWGRRAFWQVKLRWWAPPLIILAALLGRALGFRFEVLPIYLSAAAIFLYNLVFALLFSRSRRNLARESRRDRFYSILQVVFDYAVMFVMIVFTGASSSPVISFFVFHVVIAGIQFRANTAFLFAGLATLGLWLLLALELTGLLPQHPFLFGTGEPWPLLSPAHALLRLAFFSVTLFVVAAMTTGIMHRLRARVVDLAQTTRRMALLNERLNSLYAMLRSVGRERRLEPILKTVTAELAATLGVKGVAVKLRSEDGETLRLAAAHGLPADFVAKQVDQLAKSPLNRKVIEGETFVHGHIDAAGEYQLPQDLIAMGIQSVVYAPLVVEGSVIGILGAYHTLPDRFDSDDSSFFALAAELVAVAIENARGYEAIQSLLEDRARFMLQVAHNMRAPIGASLSMLDLLSGDYFGRMPPEQVEILARVERRLNALNRAIGELLAIGKARDRSREIPDVRVDVNELADRLERTFREEARGKDLRFALLRPPDLPAVDSGADLLEQILENLVSNSMKYTPSGGEVELRFETEHAGELRIVVRDTGIGIPFEEQSQLFKEFFRASNAKTSGEEGTGLGLAFVKQAVERHGGRVMLSSEPGAGTTVTVDIPLRQAR